MSVLPRMQVLGWSVAASLLVTSLLALYLLQQWYLPAFVMTFFAQMGVYALAAWCLLKGKLYAAGGERSALIAILAVAALLRGIALFAPEALSTDTFRYVWDGRVQAAGINPYRYVPADPALSSLRDAAIYPNINRADYAHTIYPPAAQLTFLALRPLSDGVIGMKVGMLAFDGLSIACLIALLRRRGLPATRVLFYAWHPLPLWEFAGTGHVDAAAIALLLVSFVFAERRAPVWTGVALAAATLVKYFPLAAAPVLYRRWDWRMPAAFIATLALLYLPYAGVGSAVFGFIPGYAAEEGLSSGSGFFLWSLLQTLFRLPADGLRYYLPFALTVMTAFALWALFQGRRSSAADTASTALVLGSAFTVLSSPHNAWYFAWLIPFLCFRFSVAHVWLTGACALIYVSPYPLGLQSQSLIYVPFLVLLAIQFRAGRLAKSPEKFHADCPQNRTAV